MGFGCVSVLLVTFSAYFARGCACRSEFRVQGSRFWVQDLGSRARGLESRVRVQGLRLRLFRNSKCWLGLYIVCQARPILCKRTCLKTWRVGLEFKILGSGSRG